MKLPRYSLRTLFVLVTLAGVICAWVTYQLHWIRQRHDFFDRYVVNRADEVEKWGVPTKCPWSLRLFGEVEHRYIVASKGHAAEAERLFPEATIFEEYVSQ